MRNLFLLIGLLSCLPPAICGPNAVLKAADEFKGLFGLSSGSRTSHDDDDPEAERDERFIEISLWQMKTTARNLVALNVHAYHNREKSAALEEDKQTSLKSLDDMEKIMRDVMHRYPNTRMDVSAKAAAAAAHQLLLEIRAYREELSKGEFPTGEGFPQTTTAEASISR